MSCIQLVNGDWNVAKGTKLSVALRSHTGQTALTSVSYGGANPPITNNSVSISVVANPNPLVMSFDAKGQLDLVSAVATCPDGSSTVLVSTMTQTSSGMSVDLTGV
jgi:hypothetical protein